MVDSEQQSRSAERVAVYVDGYNVGYRLRSKQWKRFLWLDLRRLFENEMDESQELVAVNYFTALGRRQPEEASQRQKNVSLCVGSRWGDRNQNRQQIRNQTVEMPGVRPLGQATSGENDRCCHCRAIGRRRPSGLLRHCMVDARRCGPRPRGSVRCPRVPQQIDRFPSAARPTKRSPEPDHRRYAVHQPGTTLLGTVARRNRGGRRRHTPAATGVDLNHTIKVLLGHSLDCVPDGNKRNREVRFNQTRDRVQRRCADQPPPRLLSVKRALCPSCTSDEYTEQTAGLDTAPLLA